MRRCRFGLLLGAAMVLFCPSLGAENLDRERSLDLYEQSETEYRAGRFDEAARLLQEAHRLFPNPVLLYNLARAQESAGNDREALSAYRDYLRADPETRDRGAIEKRIESIEARLRERKERDRAVARAEQRARESQKQPKDDGRGALFPWLTTGAGAGLLGAGVVFGVLARSAESDAEKADSHAAATEKFEDAERHATYANVAFVAGSLLAVAGITWLWLQSDSPTPAAGSIRVYTRGPSVGAALSF